MISKKRIVIHSGINAVKNIAYLNNLFIAYLLFLGTLYHIFSTTNTLFQLSYSLKLQETSSNISTINSPFPSSPATSFSSAAPVLPQSPDG